mmetsp:Transcript_11217/g.19766  ORF Transcript_11217/g.19766 Transcript_11217/m.19766 type:complete len:200 (-) Transcript_11217:1321-1920(-)
MIWAFASSCTTPCLSWSPLTARATPKAQQACTLTGFKRHSEACRTCFTAGRHGSRIRTSRLGWTPPHLVLWITSKIVFASLWILALMGSGEMSRFTRIVSASGLEARKTAPGRSRSGPSRSPFAGRKAVTSPRAPTAPNSRHGCCGVTTLSPSSSRRFALSLVGATTSLCSSSKTTRSTTMDRSLALMQLGHFPTQIRV